jgi:hypothetical protein
LRQHCRRPWYFTCEPCSFDSGRSGFVWVRHVWNGSADLNSLPFQTHLTQTKPVLALSNEHGSQVKYQGLQQCYHNKHKKFPYWLTRDVSFLSGHTSYFTIFGDNIAVAIIISHLFIFLFVCSVCLWEAISYSAFYYKCTVTFKSFFCQCCDFLETDKYCQYVNCLWSKLYEWLSVFTHHVHRKLWKTVLVNHRNSS